MPNYGFGYRDFGNHPFGGVDWCQIVLWEEMPEQMRDQDEEVGYPYKNFIEAMCPSFEWLRKYIERFRTLTDARDIRHDLLEYFAQNFGIDIDLAEPEEYQRTRANLAARWNIIKGTVESYIVLCRVHGFEVDVIPLWWDGDDYYADAPHILNEEPTFTTTTVSGDTKYRIWLKCSPSEPSTIDGSIGVVSFTDNGSGVLSSVHGDFISGTIDYGWGYIEILLDGSYSNTPQISYDSVVGGCVDTCRKCKTHRLKLQITPGAIGGQDELTISEAFQRLYQKLGVSTGDGVIPIHVELFQVDVAGEITISIGHRYDILEGDLHTVDTGLRWELVT